MASAQQAVDQVPGKAWRVVFAGTAINLCLGCLYAWSVWVKYLTDKEYMLSQGWTPLTAEQASNPASLCILVFALLMIPGGRIQDKYGPKLAASIGGIAIGLGLLLAGAMKSYSGILLGFGIGGGIGMGIGYAAPTPAALKWFGPHKRGLVAGLVVSGYGLAAFYVAPLAKWLITSYSMSASFYVLGVAYLIVILAAAQLLAWPEPGYVPPQPPATAASAAQAATQTRADWTAGEMLKTWQFYALVLMFCINTQAGLLLIGHAAKMIKGIMAAGYLLVSWGAIFNSVGRIGTGIISDKIGRTNGLIVNYIAAAVIMFLLPYLLTMKNIPLLFLACAIGFWCYGGGLSLFPSFTADFYGPKNLGFNYGLVFLGWGFGAFMPKLAGRIYDKYQSYDYAFYIAGILLIVGIVLALVTKRPRYSMD
ncbi:Nitrate/nitrite transporter NarK [Desulfacinum hydrothermale DSM 13146]|uniref:Nitrate/nitrite transporter NarK n=1 Tax=Desulfacinum hydrothermale DSM 13146 TaxID=1121390 RepID=A0A1W1WY69_9BACT|nr:OFA family MFS transporter [Desulfacinum hydrothermale]SMC16543.1 Nitrate/nitrite transporter NarK [Desulfacinum hydrothermale DSM 13146]